MIGPQDMFGDVSENTTTIKILHTTYVVIIAHCYSIESSLYSLLPLQQVVLGIPHEAFEDQLEALKDKVGVNNDVDLSAEQLEELCGMYLKVYDAYKKEFPQNALAQLRACIKAVFGSWNSERAIKYREINQITTLLGTACNIQTMVFGNLGNHSGTGVAFSRDPGTGESKLKGKFTCYVMKLSSTLSAMLCRFFLPFVYALQENIW